MPEAARNNHTICDPMFMQQKRNGILWSAVFNTDAHIGIIHAVLCNKNLCNIQSKDAAPRPAKFCKTIGFRNEQASPTYIDLTLHAFTVVTKLTSRVN